MLWRGIGVDYEGGVLDNAARVAIQLAHRMMAVVVFVLPAVSGRAAAAHARHCAAGAARWRCWCCAQVALGIANVVLSLPLKIAVLHNAGAVALLFVLVTLLARLRLPEA